MPLPSPTAAAAVRLAPGLALSAAAGGAAFALTRIDVGAPMSPVLYAFFIGLALHTLAMRPLFRPGVEMGARGVLRLGVALLGIRLTMGQLFDVGWLALVVAAAAVALTIVFGAWCAKAMGLPVEFGVLTGTGVGVCGVAASTAAAAVLPKHANSDRDLAFAALGCNAISTVCMLLYAPLAAPLGLDDRLMGIFLGGSIHDVAQVVGAGKAAGERILDVAVVTKLLRVALLLPAVVLIAWWVRRRVGAVSDARPTPPWFLWVFLALAAVVSTGAIPAEAQRQVALASSILITVAIAALGMKTSIRGLMSLGPAPAMLMLAQTVFVAALVLAMVVAAR